MEEQKRPETRGAKLRAARPALSSSPPAVLWGQSDATARYASGIESTSQKRAYATTSRSRRPNATWPSNWPPNAINRSSRHYGDSSTPPTLGPRRAKQRFATCSGNSRTAAGTRRGLGASSIGYAPYPVPLQHCSRGTAAARDTAMSPIGVIRTAIAVTARPLAAGLHRHARENCRRIGECRAHPSSHHASSPATIGMTGVDEMPATIARDRSGANRLVKPPNDNQPPPQVPPHRLRPAPRARKASSARLSLSPNQ